MLFIENKEELLVDIQLNHLAQADFYEIYQFIDTYKMGFST
ncbi:TPA: hypothetical protein ACGOWV_001610 [Streptococcus suis]